MNNASTEVKGELKFDVSESTVAARTATSTVDAVQTALEELGDKLEYNRDIVMKLRPFSKGSFVIPFEIWVPSLGELVPSEDEVRRIEQVVAGLTEYISVKVMLSGIAPSRVVRGPEKTEFESADGRVIATGNAVAGLLDRSRSQTDEKFAHSFHIIEQEGKIDRVVLSTELTGTVFEISRAEYGYFSRAERIVTLLPEARRIEKRETLTIVTVSFDPKLKWRFERVGGSRIHAQMDDLEFFDRLREATETFVNGDSLEVRLEYSQSRENENQPWQDDATSYRILKVEKHNRKIQTGELFDH